MIKIMGKFKKLIYIITIAIFLTGFGSTISAQSPGKKAPNKDNKTIYLDANQSTKARVEDLLSRMTLDDKAGQMVQAHMDVAYASLPQINGVGSILSGGGATPQSNTPQGWARWIALVQKSTMKSHLKIPSIYGIDAVHGHASLINSTIFPHNIGLGAANDPKLVEKMGMIVANEMMQARILWNFGPCIAIAEDPRWGRTYESFSTDFTRTANLGTAYLKGFDGAGGIATAKHFLGDGNTVFGTGKEKGIDRGNTELSIAEIRSTLLIPYKQMVDSGVQVVMTSFSSVNGLKMHNHKVLLTNILKGELGFKGFVITDWEALQEIPNANYKEQVWMAINAGNDMLMEPYKWVQARSAIVEGVENGKIDISRVDDAVRRILTVKFNAGLFEDPTIQKKAAIARKQRDPRSLAVARELVEKSMVLLKNNNQILPIKSGQKVLLLGPGKNNIGLQCGGWSITWQGSPDKRKKITQGTTIEESLKALSKEMNFELITDPKKGADADIVIIALAEKPYAEWEGDTPTPSLTKGKLALNKNKKTIDMAKTLGKPTVALILAGRHVTIEEYLNDWDAVVMAYLPGTEGDGIGRVLTGKVNFSGTLPMPWYKKINGERKEEFKILFQFGYGLKY